MTKSIISKIAKHVPQQFKITFKPSAVIVPLVQHKDGSYSLLLTKRKAMLSSYSGDYCFPGGQKDLDDKDLKTTAIREMEEEVGIGSDDHEIIGQLDDFYDGRGRLVRPFVSVVPEEALKKIKTSKSEVEKIIQIDLGSLEKVKENEHSKSRRKPSYEYLIDEDYKLSESEATIIWGLPPTISEDIKSDELSVEDKEMVWGLTASIMVHLDNVAFDKERLIGKECTTQSVSRL